MDPIRQRLLHLPRWTACLTGAALSIGVPAATVRADDADRLPDAALLERHPDFTRLYNALTDVDAAKRQALKAFYRNRDTFAAYDPARPETVKPARDAMAELFAFVSTGGDDAESNLKSIHWLLKQGAIEEDGDGRLYRI